MRPRACFVVKRSSTGSVVTLLTRIVLNTQKRLDISRAGGLRLGEFKSRGAVRIGDRATIAVDEINDGGASAGGENERGCCDKERADWRDPDTFHVEIILSLLANCHDCVCYDFYISHNCVSSSMTIFMPPIKTSYRGK